MGKCYDLYKVDVQQTHEWRISVYNTILKDVHCKDDIYRRVCKYKVS